MQIRLTAGVVMRQLHLDVFVVTQCTHVDLRRQEVAGLVRTHQVVVIQQLPQKLRHFVISVGLNIQ